jgi:hypothetical protein
LGARFPEKHRFHTVYGTQAASGSDFTREGHSAAKPQTKKNQLLTADLRA